VEFDRGVGGEIIVLDSDKLRRVLIPESKIRDPDDIGQSDNQPIPIPATINQC
jgi:hypothetical protein